MRFVALVLAVLLCAAPAHAMMVKVYLYPMQEDAWLTYDENVADNPAYGDVMKVYDDSWTVDPLDPRMGGSECWNKPWSNNGDYGCVYVEGVTYGEAYQFGLDKGIWDDVTEVPTVFRRYYLMIDSMNPQSRTSLLNSGYTSETWAKMKNWFCDKETGVTPGGKTCP